MNEKQNHLYILYRDTKNKTAQKWKKKTDVGYYWTDGIPKSLIKYATVHIKERKNPSGR